MSNLSVMLDIEKSLAGKQQSWKKTASVSAIGIYLLCRGFPAEGADQNSDHNGSYDNQHDYGHPVGERAE